MTHNATTRPASPEFGDLDFVSRRSREMAWGVIARKIGPRFANATLAGFVVDVPSQRIALDRLRAYLAEMPDRVAAGCGLILHGPQGRGKTHLMAAMLRNAVLTWGLSVDWRDALELFTTARMANRSESRRAELLRDLVAPAILAIDDPIPPSRRVLTAHIELLQRVVDERYRLRRPTWITANVADEEAGMRILSPPLWGRLRDGAIIIAAGTEAEEWPSHRRQAAD